MLPRAPSPLATFGTLSRLWERELGMVGSQNRWKARSTLARKRVVSAEVFASML
jgi:hypothetical protein